ncbi:MAG TPA: hypothetical protein VFI31_23110 [Pirellulales bacterium]|nr:hypothetical protein [Pirellulales bacterium]
MTGGQHTRTKALDRLWKWTDDDNDELRIAGLVGLCSASAEGLGEAFEKALAGPSAKVRVAAAEQVFKKFEEQRPYSEEMIAPIALDTVVDDFEERVVDIDEDDNLLAAVLWQGMKRVLFGTKSKASIRRHGKDEEVTSGEEATMAESETRSEEPADEGEEGLQREPQVELETPADLPAETPSAGKTVKTGRKGPDPWEPWLAEMRSDEGRPKWAKKLAAPLEKMLAPDHSPEERWAAALALVPLAQEDRSLPVLRELIAAEPKRVGDAAKSLPWLPWEKRIAWFDELKNQANGPDVEIQLVHSFTLLRDLRADEPLWQVLGSERVTPAIAQELLDDLKRVYRIGQPHYGNGSPPAPQLDVDRARHYATAGTNWQRLAALALLLAAEEPAAAEVAGLAPATAAPRRPPRACVGLPRVGRFPYSPMLLSVLRRAL